MPLTTTPLGPDDFPVEDGYGFADLLIDYRVLVENRWLLNIANDNSGTYTVHVACDREPTDFDMSTLDSTFSTYARECCFSLGCSITACYMIGNETTTLKAYGWDDGAYAMEFNLHRGDTTDELLEMLQVGVTTSKPLVVIKFDETSDDLFSAYKVEG